MAYGTAVGYRPLRAWIADKHGVEPEQVIVTNGSMQADAFLFDELVADGDGVIVERPTYDRTLLSLRGRGADITAVALEADGIDVDALGEALRSGRRPTLAHIIPNFQNPAGYTLSHEKRRRLVALANEHDFTIFEDDPYFDIRFRGNPLPPMFELEGADDRVVYASSFSKTVCPGIRVGYLVGSESLIAGSSSAPPTRTSRRTWSPSRSSTSSAGRGRSSDSIETVRDALRDRADALAEALRSELPEARFVEPDGGYFLWVDLPDAIDVDELHAAAADRGVAVRQGVGLPARRRRAQPPTGLLGRDRRADPGGRAPPRGGNRRTGLSVGDSAARRDRASTTRSSSAQFTGRAAQRPAHWADQLPLYDGLLYASPTLTDADVPEYFKDATFGAKPERRRVAPTGPGRA